MPTKSRAGLVQLADSSMIRGAKGTSATGVSDKAVVTALDLANELDVRFDNSVAGGNGVTVSTQSIELPGGDPNDPNDNITQFGISIGLPFNNQTLTFANLGLGDVAGQKVNTISSAVDKSNARTTALVTERALRDYSVESDQITSGAVTFGKVNTLAYRTSSQGIRSFSTASDASFATEKSIAQGFDSISASLNTFINNGFSKSLLPRGFQRIAGGLIIQWGVSSVLVGDGVSETQTFAIPFTAAIFSIVASKSGGAVSGAGDKKQSWVVSNKTLTSFVITSYMENASGQYDWIAIGY
jgi:hypothetical protein